MYAQLESTKTLVRMTHSLLCCCCSVQVFLRPIQRRGLLTREECISVFSNIEALYNMTQILLQKLEGKTPEEIAAAAAAASSSSTAATTTPGVATAASQAGQESDGEPPPTNDASTSATTTTSSTSAAAPASTTTSSSGSATVATTADSTATPATKEEALFPLHIDIGSVFLEMVQATSIRPLVVHKLTLSFESAGDT